jgi:regulator of protease activity HflC (stomatin/prohibitin superfamily)
LLTKRSFRRCLTSCALTLKSANSERGKINSELQRTMREETMHWGIEIVRTELKEIDPPEDVQETMNKVVKAENEKVAAIDFRDSHRDDGRRRTTSGDQESRGHQAGKDPSGRRRSAGHPIGQ